METSTEVPIFTFVESQLSSKFQPLIEPNRQVRNSLSSLFGNEQALAPQLCIALLKWIVEKDSRHVTSAKLMGEVLVKLQTTKNYDMASNILRTMICQNYYVTLQAPGRIALAMETFPQVRNQIKAFVDSEKGHDKLVYKSLSKIADSNEYIVLDPIKKVMELIEDSAKHNYLAFIVILDMLEGTDVIEPGNPKTKLWDFFSFLPQSDEILEGVRLHDQINENENHQNISQNLMGAFKSYKPQQFLEAIDLVQQTITQVTRLNLHFASLM